MEITKIKAIERSSKAKWEREEISKFNKIRMNQKYYVMDMFSYPSGAKLHLGHWFNFAPVDSFARFKKMQGYNVFQPMGFDAFGLPAENYAIKSGIHPKDSTMKNIQKMRQQLIEMGGMFDWENEVITCEPEYYKWTQWIFTLLYKRGLAYRKDAPVNWCNSCKTVLAREQVLDGKCERCGSEVRIKRMNQWFLKITDYADELLSELDNLDWPEKTKAMQKNWIGKSKGVSIIFNNESVGNMEIFTTRPDTIFGVTYLVIAPEHDLVNSLVTKDHEEEVRAYIKKTEMITEIERQGTTHEKTGVFTGSYAKNPLTGKMIPIWISDYVIGSYGTGIVMAVPAHDKRDYEFAKKYKLDIIPVIDGFKDEDHCAFTGDGILINSEFLNGKSTNDAKASIIEYLKETKSGNEKTTYHLRDWLISRQRYWGAPIPIIYCNNCGEVVVPEEQLPVTLPYNVDFNPNGESPLSHHEEFVNCKCPRCGRSAKREVDTMDTFMCSSWYMFRYTDSHNEKKAFDSDIVNQMMPVDKYVGGAEHSCMHLIYARFITKVLRDAGYINFGEPFKSLVHQGIILGTDGQKMSKSRGNTVSPDEYIDMYGSDIFRTYLMFGFNYLEGGPWSDSGIVAIKKFYEKVDKCFDKFIAIKHFTNVYEGDEINLEISLNNVIDKVTTGFEAFQFNTSIARIMELFSSINKYLEKGRNSNVIKDVMEKAIKLIAPSAPHISEYYWEKLGNKTSIFFEKWPEIDKAILENLKIEVPVQINSKNIAIIEIVKGADKESVTEISKEYVDVKLNGRKINKIIFVPDRIINFIVK